MSKININDFLNFNYLGNLKANKEETYYAYLVSKANLGENGYNHILYVSDGEKTHKAVNLGKYNSFYFLNETSIIVAYAKTKEEENDFLERKTPLYKYDILRKSFEYYKTLYLPVRNLTVVSEDTWLIESFLSESNHLIYEDPANRSEILEMLKNDELYEEIKSIPFYFDGGSFIKEGNNQLITFNPITNEYKNVFPKDINLSQVNYQKETNKIYLLAKKRSEVLNFYSDCYIYDLETKTLEQVYKNTTLNIASFFELNNRYYVLAAPFEEYGINANNHFYTIVNKEAVLMEEFGFSTYNSIGSDVRLLGSKSSLIKDNKLYFLSTQKDRSKLYFFDNNVNDYYNEKISIDGLINFKDNFILIALVEQNLQELYKLDYSSKELIKLSNYNDEALKDKYVSKPIYHEYYNNDTKLDGWVMLPKDYDKNKLYPAILDIHGGPKTIYSDVYYHEMQVWANKGYIVYFCNPRGSDSYSDDFADIRGKYGTIDYDDIMAFKDFVLKNYSVDKNKLGVTGGSYGGFMTNWIVTHNNDFKVAATQRSISNWISFYGTSDIGFYFQTDQTASHPISDFEKAWEQSPLKYANNIKTPLLFIHSDKDYRCPIEQAMQLYTVVKKNGVDSKLVWFKNENHGLSRGGRPKSRIKRLEEITNWFIKYLGES